MSKDCEGRPNITLATSVDEALRAVDTRGQRHAARLMSTAGVPFSVVVRVLAEPDKRRRINDRPTETLFPIQTE